MEDRSYGDLYAEYLELLQKYEPKAKAVHLLFAPIGTNALFLADQLWVNASRGIRTEITSGHYDHDREYIENYNREHSTHHTLDPWILQRYDDHHDHPKPWEIWFRSLEDNEATAENYGSAKKRLRRDLKNYGEPVDREALERGACLHYVTRFNSETLKFVEKHDQIDRKETIAVHIRRGDACSEDLEKADPNRDNHSLFEYMAEIEKYRIKGCRNFYILTESQREIDLLRDRFEGECRILSADLARRNFIRIPKSEFNQKYFVEYECLQNPDFAKFLMESALIDMYNAQQCVGFIGTFSSQFSVANWLKMTGFHKRAIPHENLSPVPFNWHYVSKRKIPTLAEIRVRLRLKSKYLGLLDRIDSLYSKKRLCTQLDREFQEYAARSGKKAILVLRERDVGFFSLFLQVVNTLLSIEEEKLDCSVYVEFGENQAYFQKSNTWLDFYDPIQNQDSAPSLSQLRRIEKDYQKVKHNLWVSDEKGVVYSAGNGLFWTGSYYPNFTPDSRSKFVSHQTVPALAERVRASEVIKKYLLPNSEIRDELNRFIDNNGIKGHIIGVQFRGTDARSDGRRVVPSYEAFIEAINAQLKDRADNPVIVVASDEKTFIERISSTFQNVKSYESPRHQSGDQFDGKGPQGWSMPKFVGENRDSALRGVIMDYLIISMADVLIHNVGSVSSAALLTNPEIKSIRIGPDIS